MALDSYIINSKTIPYLGLYMVIIMKKTILFLMVIFLMIGACGCMLNNNENKAEIIKDAALKHLEQNYSDSFKPLGYVSDDWAYDYSTVSFESKKYDDTVEVRVYSGDSEYIFEDNYFTLVMHDDSEEFFDRIIRGYGLSAVVKTKFVSFSLPKNLDGELSFAEYVSSEQCNMEVYLITEADVDSQILESILTDICNAKIMGLVKFVTTNDKNLLSDYDIDAIANNEKELVKSKTSYCIDNEFHVQK